MSLNKYTTNNDPTLAAVSNADGETPKYLYADDTSHALLTKNTNSFTPGVDYDYLDVQQTSGTVETYVYKTGGSGGTTVRTITVTYTSSSKTDIDTVVWS